MKILIYFFRLILPVLPHMFLALCLSIFAMLSSVALMAAAAWLIAFAAYHPAVYELSFAIIGVRFFGIARAVSRYGERYFSHNATFHILSHLRTDSYQRLETLLPIQNCKWTNSDLSSLLLRKIDTLKDFYLRVLSPVLTAIVVLIVIAVVMFFYAPVISLLLICAFFLIAICIPYIILRHNKRNLSAAEACQSRLNNQCVDAVYGIADLTACNRVSDILTAIKKTSIQADNLKEKVFRVNALTNALAESVTSLTIIAAICLLVPLVRDNTLTGIHLAVIVLTVQSSFESILQLPVVWHYYAAAEHAASSIFFLPEPEIQSNPTNIVCPVAAPLVEVENVSFSYSGGAAVFSGLTFALQPGERIAIVGASGVGKSTLFSLLLNLYAAEGGCLKLNGIPYVNLAPEFIRTKFNTVMQETHFFHQTIRGNFQMLHPDATQEEMMIALTKAKLDTFVKALPDGLDTMIGQRGNQLSGGQRQRLALACALLKPAPILLLDEPTTGLDVRTAKQIMQTIFALPDRQAIILITHDLIELAQMDRIIVLQDGTIAETGNYQELIDKQGLFYKMRQFS